MLPTTPIKPPRILGFTLIEILIVVIITATLALIAISTSRNALTQAKMAGCLNNMRQIGISLASYSTEHNGRLPPTTHSTGSWRREQSWIYQLKDQIADLDKVRICPAEPAKRREKILKLGATSYVLNDLIFDDAQYHNLTRIPNPSQAMLAFVMNEDRAPSTTNDHVHGAEWTSWASFLQDVEADRHRVGSRAQNRLSGSSNYLYADGHAENLTATYLKSRYFDTGRNPAQPQHP